MSLWRAIRRKIGDDGLVMNGAQVMNAVVQNLNMQGVIVMHACVGDFRDAQYRCISDDDMRWMVSQYRLDDPKYQEDKFDCDDSGDTFMGDIKRGWADASKFPEALGFGWIWLKFDGESRTHWMNWQLNKNRVLKLWEPQQNKSVERKISTVFAFGA